MHEPALLLLSSLLFLFLLLSSLFFSLLLFTAFDTLSLSLHPFMTWKEETEALSLSLSHLHFSVVSIRPLTILLENTTYYTVLVVQ